MRIHSCHGAIVLAVGVLALLGGCCTAPRPPLFSASLDKRQFQVLRDAAEEPMNVTLVNGKTLADVKYMGRVWVDGRVFVAFQNEDEERFLIRADQISMIHFPQMDESVHAEGTTAPVVDKTPAANAPHNQGQTKEKD